ISISTNNDVELIYDDLLWSEPILIYSLPTVPNSYIDNDKGRKSFKLLRKSYNGVTGYRNLDSNMIVSYNNEHDNFNNQLDSIEEKYIKKKSASNKHIRTNLPVASFSKVSKNDKLSNNQFLEATSQIKSNILVSDKDSNFTEQDN
ncbi:28732_t:CDS:2, partial [Racocetra persica]